MLCYRRRVNTCFPARATPILWWIAKRIWQPSRRTSTTPSWRSALSPPCNKPPSSRRSDKELGRPLLNECNRLFSAGINFLLPGLLRVCCPGNWPRHNPVNALCSCKCAIVTSPRGENWLLFVLVLEKHDTSQGAGKGAAVMPRVLLAEDDDAVRYMLSTALERDGFDVVAVSSVREALGRIVAQDFDALLSDLHMPHAGDGFTVVSAMRNIHPKAVTLVLSGYPQLDEALSAIRLQADEILVKPIEISSLREIIRRKLANPVSFRPLPT